MPRRARIKSQYLHLIVRGIGKQLLFEDDFDRAHYLALVRRFRDEVGIKINAYCLMGNHVHLLINDPERKISLFMKKLGICYAQYYNRKYERTGHLFQDRYKSETVMDEAYYLTVFRYIINNPVKAGISRAEDYKWSSYGEYGKKGLLTDTSLLRKLIGNKQQLNEFLSVKDNVECMEDSPRRHDDRWALEIIHNELGLISGTAVQKMSKVERNRTLVEMKKQGLTIRQIERLTGVNRGIIQVAR